MTCKARDARPQGRGRKCIPQGIKNTRAFALAPRAFYITDMTQPPTLFDRLAPHAPRRGRSDALFLHKAARDELYDRLSMVNREFKDIAIVTDHGEIWRDLLSTAIVISPTEHLKLAPQSYDLILHFMALHWNNDPVGQLIQSVRALRPDGLFLGACFGGKSLEELRAAWLTADSQISGGAYPRVAPMMDIRDAGALMQRAGFAMPVVDSEETRVRYGSLRDLMRDLRHMNETNRLSARPKHPTRRASMAAAEKALKDNQERFAITAETLYFSGWAPSPDQPKPLRPGSAAMRLEDALRAAKDAME